jgi:hypothetical protein
MKIVQPKLFEKVKRRLVVTPTSPQLKIVLIGDDYGLKVSIRKNRGRAFSGPALRNRSLLHETTNSNHPCGNFMPSHMYSNGHAGV